MTVKNCLDIYALPVGGKLWLVKKRAIELESLVAATNRGSTIGLNTSKGRFAELSLYEYSDINSCEFLRLYFTSERK